MPDPFYLPGADEAVVSGEKLRGYALNPEHPTGKAKARVFRSALDIGPADSEFLRAQILDRIRESAVTAIRPNPPWGLEYEVILSIDGRNGESRRVVTGWLVAAEEAPRLITLYVQVTRTHGRPGHLD